MSEHVLDPALTITELDDDRTELAYPALRELRPHLSDLAQFLEQVRQQRAEGYRLVGIVDTSAAVSSVAGFRLVTGLAWGRHLYIDDLCTLPQARGRGHASALLAWIDDEAQRLGCAQVHLDSAPHRHTAHRRYLSTGYVISALHFSKPGPAQ